MKTRPRCYEIPTWAMARLRPRPPQRMSPLRWLLFGPRPGRLTWWQRHCTLEGLDWGPSTPQEAKLAQQDAWRRQR